MNRYVVDVTNEFKRDLKRCKKRGLPMEELRNVVNMLSEIGTLPEKYRPHKLHGNKANQWECHIKPDWLLIWAQDDYLLTLLMINTGSHSDLFG